MEIEIKEARKIYNALNALQKFCAAQEECLFCPCRGKGGNCKILSSIPQYWKLRKPVAVVFEEGDE